MTYNVFGETLNLAQSIYLTTCCSRYLTKLKRNRHCDHPSIFPPDVVVRYRTYNAFFTILYMI